MAPHPDDQPLDVVALRADDEMLDHLADYAGPEPTLLLLRAWQQQVCDT